MDLFRELTDPFTTPKAKPPKRKPRRIPVVDADGVDVTPGGPAKP